MNYYNIIYSDPAPYVTLCTYGCLSVETCTVQGQNWGNVSSLSFVFGSAMLLSAQVLGIKFCFYFMKLSEKDLTECIQKVKENFEKIKKESENSEVANVTQSRENENKKIEDDFYSNKDENEVQGNVKNIQNSKPVAVIPGKKAVGIRSDFYTVEKTMLPIKYKK